MAAKHHNINVTKEAYFKAFNKSIYLHISAYNNDNVHIFRIHTHSHIHTIYLYITYTLLVTLTL